VRHAPSFGQRRILNWLANGPRTVRELVDALTHVGASGDAVRSSLRRMEALEGAACGVSVYAACRVTPARRRSCESVTSRLRKAAGQYLRYNDRRLVTDNPGGTVRPSVRFEVLKRDGFTCVYCGRNRDKHGVVLEVDHVVPLAEGGSDNDLANLATACWDCNHGKAARLLDHRAPAIDFADAAARIREREEQVAGYKEALTEREQRIRVALATIDAYWAERWCGMNQYRPFEHVLRKALDIIPVEEILDAIDIALIQRTKYHGYDTCRYFGGVLKRKIARAEGRVVACQRCGKDVVLEPEQDASRLWWHGDCFAIDHPEEAAQRAAENG
jgi:5-methylcytosine-specific restriction endonuclease McrA